MRLLPDVATARAVVDSWCVNPKYAATNGAQRESAAQALLTHVGGPGGDLEAPDGNGGIVANSFDLGKALGLTPDLA